MATVSFQHPIEKFEFNNQCVLLWDEKKKDYASQLPVPRLIIKAGGKSYEAGVNDYYVDGKFQAGIGFEKDAAGKASFFFEQSLNLGHLVIITFTPKSELVAGRFMLSVELSLKTK